MNWFASFFHDYPFSTHMVVHMFLAQVAAPLFLLAFPRASITRISELSVLGKFIELLRLRPFTWLTGMAAMWAWHLPVACQAVANHAGLGLIEDICFFLSGIVFWWPIFAPLPRERMNPVPWAVLYLVSACVSCTVLGILLAFAPATVFHSSSAYGMTEMTAVDQHAGGLTMWVPGCLIYLTAVIAMFARWYSAAEEAPVSEGNPAVQSGLTR